MSTITVPPRRATAQPPGETRILVTDASWTLYEGFVKSLPENSAIRTAFDGRDMEIMVKGVMHDHFAELLGLFVMTVAGELGIRIKPQGESTWIRPEIERGIEADRCYYFDPGKITESLAAVSRKVNDVAAYPNPDLAIEIDLSAPQADREAIYAMLNVTELWIFGGDVLTMKHLDEQGRYHPIERSRFLRIRADQVRRWLTEEDLSDYGAWTRRLREWVEKELREQ